MNLGHKELIMCNYLELDEQSLGSSNSKGSRPTINPRRLSRDPAPDLASSCPQSSGHRT